MLTDLRRVAADTHITDFHNCKEICVVPKIIEIYYTVQPFAPYLCLPS